MNTSGGATTDRTASAPILPAPSLPESGLPAPTYPWEHVDHTALLLPRHVRLVLLAAQSAEQTTTGPARRRAFETTRILLGGALDAGYSTRTIGDCLGVKPESVRTRAEPGRELTLTAMEAVAGLNPDTLTRLGHPALFGPPRHDHNGHTYYQAAAIIRGLATLR